MTRPEPTRGVRTVAVVGAGMAGATAARALLDEGIEVHVFDKSRGPGGRLATRRSTWLDAQGQARVTPFDHGAPWFSARDAEFLQAVAQAVHVGAVTTWRPRYAAQGLPPDEGDAMVFLPAPTMTRWCRWLLDDARLHWEQPVDVLHRRGGGWQLEGHESVLAPVFDAVLLALPPAQAATLLAPHQREWAQRASLLPMQPCWTVMGVSDELPGLRAWDVARPESCALGLVLRNETRPGRAARHGEVHWVLHARPGWSRAHIEDEPTSVQQALQQALSAWLGARVHWHHAVTHRWRYAQAHASRQASSAKAWWDERLRLGVCGDFLGGGACGVEGAWRSARWLAQRLLQRSADAPAPVCASAHVATSVAPNPSSPAIPAKELS